jgi:branched-chain amino acid transport system permease protein
MAHNKEKSDLHNDLVEDQITISRPSFGERVTRFTRRSMKNIKGTVKHQVPLTWNDAKSWVKSFRGKIIILFFIVALAGPLYLNENLWYYTFVTTMIYAIFAASWDLLAGVTGQVSFGHAAFFGIGGYAFAIFNKWLGLSWFLSIFIGGIIAVVFGLIIAVPSLRLKGPYLALGTLAFNLLILQLFKMESLKVTFPFFGIDGIRDVYSYPFITPLFLDYRLEFFIVFIFMVICIISLLAIYNSNLGTIFKAIRDDEISTEALGINVKKYKLFAFMISSFFAGIAGSLYTLHTTRIDPMVFAGIVSFMPVIMVILGGIATISGSVFGAYFFILISALLKDFFRDVLPLNILMILSDLSVLIFAIVLLIVVRFSERGLMEPVLKNTEIFWDNLLGK